MPLIGTNNITTEIKPGIKPTSAPPVLFLGFLIVLPLTLTLRLSNGFPIINHNIQTSNLYTVWNNNTNAKTTANWIIDPKTVLTNLYDSVPLTNIVLKSAPLP